MQLITINEAAKLSGKSIQTIRRMIKQKKIQVKRHKTPQGFNYLIIKGTLEEHLEKNNQSITHLEPTIQGTIREHRSVKDDYTTEFKPEFERLGSTIQKLVDQNEKDKENFFGLIKTFQDRIFVLENHIKMLEAPRPRWWQFWK